MIPNIKGSHNSSNQHQEAQHQSSTSFVYHLSRFNTLEGIFKNHDLPTDIHQNIKEQSNTLPNQKTNPFKQNIILKKTKGIKRQNEKTEFFKKKQYKKMKNICEGNQNNKRNELNRDQTQQKMFLSQQNQINQRQIYYQSDQDIYFNLQKDKKDKQFSQEQAFQLQQNQQIKESQDKVCHHIQSYDYLQPYRLKEEFIQKHEELSCSHDNRLNESISHTESNGRRNSRIRRQQINMRYQSPQQRKQQQQKFHDLYQQLMGDLFRITLENISHEDLQNVLSSQFHLDFPQRQAQLHYFPKQQYGSYKQEQEYEQKDMKYKLSSIKQNIKQEDNIEQKQQIKENIVNEPQILSIENKEVFQLAMNFYNQEDDGFHFDQNVQDHSYDHYLGYNYLNQ